MFEDDPDPLVTTGWVGFGGVSDARKRVDALCKEGLGGLTRGNRKHGWSRKGQWTQRREARSGNYERMQALKTMTATRCWCNADDAMMKCDQQINTHNDHKEHGRRLERQSWGVTTLHHYKRISSRDLGLHRRENEKGRGKTKLLLDKRVKPWTSRGWTN